MREIKFRVWSPLNKKMYKLGKIEFEYGLTTLFPECWQAYTNSALEPEAILLQYTGLTDKNGKEIYEGDIVLVRNWSRKYTCSKCGHSENTDTTAIVSWQNEYTTGEYDDHYHSVARFSLKYNTSSEYALEDDDGLEVIGNIHENPELLEII